MSEQFKRWEEQMAPTIEPIEKMLDQLQVSAVFGEPTREGEVTIIPVAEIRYGFGYGYGYGHGGPEEGEGAEGDREGGGGLGSGAGGGGAAKPRGFIRIAPDGVFFQDVLDITRLGMAGIAFAAWAVYCITKTVRTARASATRKR